MSKLPAFAALGKGQEAPARAPYLRLFPTDRAFDAKLRLCSRAARDFWSDLYGVLAHFSEPRGYVLVGARKPSTAELARLFGDSEAEVVGWLEELERNGVFSRTDLAHPLGPSVIYCRRMVREAAKLARDRANGAAGGNPELAQMRALADGNLAGALRDVEKRAANAERARRYRLKKTQPQTETTVTLASRSRHAKTSRVTLRVTVDKRDAAPENRALPEACATVTGVNPHLPLSIPREESVLPPVLSAARARAIPARRSPLNRGGAPPAQSISEPSAEQRSAFLAEQRRRLAEAFPDDFAEVAA